MRASSLLLLLFLACSEPSSSNQGEEQTPQDQGSRPLDIEAIPDQSLPLDLSQDAAPLPQDLELRFDQEEPLDLPELLSPCADGLDNDEDGLIDFPEDPGCDSLEDLDERDEEGVCGPEHEAQDISALSRVEASTVGLPALFDACRVNHAPEIIFRYTLTQPVARLHIDTAGSDFDTLLSLRSDCAEAASELICNDDASAVTRSSALDLEEPALMEYFIIVDGFLEEAGQVQLQIRAELPDAAPCPGEEAPASLSCAPGRGCQEGLCQPLACADGEDNDGDGFIDLMDPGCEALADVDEVDPEQPPECADGEDNDRDGRADYPDDLDCSAAGDPEERPRPVCSDGLDNDGDGLIDFPQDPGCLSPEGENEFDLEACRNAQDDDEDGLIDYPHDPGCLNPLDVDEQDPEPLPACADGLDNDEDGLIDYPDDRESCLFSGDETEGDPCEAEVLEISGLHQVRGNNTEAQNELHGACVPHSGPEARLLWRVEEERPLRALELNASRSRITTVIHSYEGCGGPLLSCGERTQRLEGPFAPGEALFIVVDGRSATAIGVWQLLINARVDEGGLCEGGPPWSCAEGMLCRVAEDDHERCRKTACADGLDNDGDGLIDHPQEPGCERPSDDDELDPPERPACSDGLDNDGDGLIDFLEEPRCESAADPSEGPECSDGVDNDGDGRLDFDRDGDGQPDRGDDEGCACLDDELESVEPECDDHCDNDADGLIDLMDPGCEGDPLGVREANLPHCEDRQDNDGDGLIDYPADPGCDYPHDPLEDNPEHPPACWDGLDNDEDGLIDFGEDPECRAASSLYEEGPCAGEIPALPEEQPILGSTFGARNEHEGSCSVGQAPERVYRLEIPYPARLHIWTEQSYNTLLYARQRCEPLLPCPPEAESCQESFSEIDCNDNSGGRWESRLEFEWLGGPFYLFVDGFGASRGAFQLQVEAIYPEGGACGPDLSLFARCEEGQRCLPDENAGYPRCQEP